ncbi:MAG: hypothetical protein NTY64_14725 [Deltaproteobacteria bacterium]|nr:hypothetical protein [Deltaproteobacteria bacterium]
MKTTLITILATLTALGVNGVEPKFTKGMKIQADGQPIDIEAGHLVPCVTDWNGDGKKDLLAGTDTHPVFQQYELLQTGGKPIKLNPG